MSGCCVVRSGAPPGRLEPERELERSGSRGGEIAPAAAASAKRRSVTLETLAGPRGPGAGRALPRPASPAPGQEGASPAQPAVGTNTAPGARLGVQGARGRPFLPPSPRPRYSAARQLPITSRPSLRACDTHPLPRPALSGLGICSGGQVEGRGGGDRRGL